MSDPRVIDIISRLSQANSIQEIQRIVASASGSSGGGGSTGKHGHTHKFTGSDMIESAAEFLAELSGKAGAAFDWNDQLLQKVKGIDFTDPTELTIDADGAITVTQTFHTVDTFEDAAFDDLDTINGGSEGQLLILAPAHEDRAVLLRHGQDNIWFEAGDETGSDMYLDTLNRPVLFVYHNSNWIPPLPELNDFIIYKVEEAIEEWLNEILLDEDDMASDSDVSIATQQSIKAYVDHKAIVYARAFAVLDLSGAAQSNVVILHTTRNLTLLKLTALYTEASSADAGVSIKVGKESDDDYFYTGTSAVSKAQWYEDDLTLLQTDLSAGDTLICSCAGGKAGTGEILFCIEAEVA